VRLWDSVTGECFRVFDDHKRPVYALSFSPNGKWLATGSGDGWLHIYNVTVNSSPPTEFKNSSTSDKQTKEKTWSWYAGTEKPGVFKIDWQRVGDVNRIALALECHQVAIIDVAWIPALQDYP
jgi:transducin (beta)-like 1